MTETELLNAGDQGLPGAAPTPQVDSAGTWTLGGRELSSRLIVGSARTTIVLSTATITVPSVVRRRTAVSWERVGPASAGSGR